MVFVGLHDVMGVFSVSISAIGCWALLQAPTNSGFLSLLEVALNSLPARGAVGDRTGVEGNTWSGPVLHKCLIVRERQC